MGELELKPVTTDGLSLVESKAINRYREDIEWFLENYSSAAAS